MQFSLKTLLSVSAVSLFLGNGFAQDPNYWVFLAFGQSNMEGNPRIEEVDRGEVSERFQFMSAVDCPAQNRTAGEWSVATPPLCRCGTGLNPCDYFGRTLVDSLPEEITIGIINVAVAGCAIEMFDKDRYQTYVQNQADWLKNIANEYGGNPYGKLVELAKEAQKVGVIKGFLLHQGESGSSTNNWAGEVQIIYDNLIEDLGLETGIPLLVGDLVNSSNMIKNLPQSMDNAYIISSDNLSSGDNLHFDAVSIRTFGARYAEKYLELIEDEQIISVSPKSSYQGYSFSHIVINPSRKLSLSFDIPVSDLVTVVIHNMAGKEIKTLTSQVYSAGKHELVLNKDGLPGGMFIIKMKSGEYSNQFRVSL